MNQHLKRRQLEKIWNILQEVKAKIDLGYVDVAIPLIGGWVLKMRNENGPKEEIDANLLDRKHILKQLENGGYISGLKFSNDLVALRVTDKFQGHYIRIGRNYRKKAKEYQKIIELDEKPIKYKGMPPRAYAKGRVGYIELNNKIVRMGPIDSRCYKLIKELLSHFGVSKVYDKDDFQKIQITKDSKNTQLQSQYAERVRHKIIRDAVRELQSKIKPYQSKVRRLAFSVSLKRGVMAYYKN